MASSRSLMVVLVLLSCGMSNGLRVEGDRFVEEEEEGHRKKVIRLVGTSWPQRAEGCELLGINKDTMDGIRSWGQNAVRIPIDEQCWLGIRGTTFSYRSNIKELVDLVLENKMYPILSLEESHEMPNTEFSIDAWASLAAHFSHDNSILFELYALPQPSDWECWRFGSEFCSLPFRAAGMDRLVTTIRETGANNVLLLPGISKATDLSNWLDFAPLATTSNLAASLRFFETDSSYSQENWQHAIDAIKKQVPLLVTDSTLYDTNIAHQLWRYLDDRNTSYLAGTWASSLAPEREFGHLLERDDSNRPSIWGFAWKEWLSQRASISTTTPSNSSTLTRVSNPDIFVMQDDDVDYDDDDYDDDDYNPISPQLTLEDELKVVSPSEEKRQEPVLLPDFYDSRLRHNILFSAKVAFACALLFALVARWRSPRRNSEQRRTERILKVSSFHTLSSKSLGGGSHDQLLSEPSLSLSSGDFTPAWESWLELEEDTSNLLPTSSSSNSLDQHQPKRN